MQNKSSAIDIGENAPLIIQNVLGYYAPSNRATESGLIFKTYYGLRQYYVSGGFDNRLLTLEDPKEILACSRERKWTHVGDLRMRLMAALLHNVRLNHSVVSHVKPDDSLEWLRRSPKLNKQEQAWLEIVRSVMGCK
jgi:hypothetical protein